MVIGLLLQVLYQGQFFSPMMDRELAAESKGPREGGKAGKYIFPSLPPSLGDDCPRFHKVEQKGLLGEHRRTMILPSAHLSSYHVVFM